jgi:hypothetical protein
VSNQCVQWVAENEELDLVEGLTPSKMEEKRTSNVNIEEPDMWEHRPLQGPWPPWEREK